MPTGKAETFVAKKLNGGPAGWKCPCCNPMGCHPRNMKPKARRMTRRVTKAITSKEIKDD